MDPIARTACWTAAARAVESRRPDRLFEDSFASALAGPEGFALLDKMHALSFNSARANKPPNPYFAIRTRFLDDFVMGAVAATVATQTVIVAAGFDTRAFRLQWPDGMRLFELDRPDLLSLKQAALAGRDARPGCRRYAVGVDLADQWVPALIEAGFDPGKRSVWVIEGLLAYLDESAVRSLVERVTGVSSPGSRMAADVPGRAFIDSPWTQPFLQALAHEGAPWKFGTDAPEAMLANHGWVATAHRPGEEGANYGRWPYPVLPRAMTAVPSSFFVTAVRQSP